MTEDDLEYEDIGNGCPVLEGLCVAALVAVVLALAKTAVWLWG